MARRPPPFITRQVKTESRSRCGFGVHNNRNAKKSNEAEHDVIVLIASFWLTRPGKHLGPERGVLRARRLNPRRAHFGEFGMHYIGAVSRA
jgi:hypothetical protein